MELQRQRTSLTETKVAGSLLRIIELFKGVKVPASDPVAVLDISPPVANHQANVIDPLSINGHRTIALGKGCHALPSMSIPNKFLNVWERSVRERLVNEIGQFFRSEICQPELLMVSDSSGKIGPCIVVSVWDESQCDSEDGKRKTIRKAKKRLRKFQSMQNCAFPFKVIADKISLASHWLDSHNISVSASSAALRNRQTLVGLQLSAQILGQQRQFRLGGLIQSGGKVYGLTVAHSFRPAAEPDTTSSQSQKTGSDTDSTEEYEESDSEGSLFDSNHYTLPLSATMAEEEQTAVPWQDLYFGPAPAVTCDIPLPHASPAGSSDITIGHLAFLSDDSPGARGTGDWALIELDDSIPVLPNLYVPAHAQRSIHIDAVHSDQIPLRTNVIILAGLDRHIHGIVGQHNVKLTVDGLDLIVTQIMVSEPLGPGYSGSWIVRDNLLVGCMVAVRKCLPIVYAILATSVIGDIAQYMGDPNTGIANLDLTSLGKQRSSSSRPLQNLQSDKLSVRVANEPDGRQVDQQTRLPLDVSQGRRAGRTPHATVDPDAITVVSGQETNKSKFENHEQIAEEQSDDSPPSAGIDRDQIPVLIYPKFHLGSGAAPLPGVLSTTESSISIEKPTQLAHKIISSQGKKDEEDNELKDDDNVSGGLSNSRNWSRRQFWIMWALVSYQSFLSGYAHSMLGPVIAQIKLDLGIKNEVEAQMVYSVFSLGSIVPSAIAIPLSKKYGRALMLRTSLVIFIAFNVACGFAKSASTLILFRFLSGVGGSVPLVIGGSVIMDMIEAGRSRKKTPILLYHIFWAGNLCIGPMASAWIQYKVGWRWIFWAISIAAFVLLPVLLIGGRETYTPCIPNKMEEQMRKQMCKQMRKQTGNRLIYPKRQRGSKGYSLIESFSTSLNAIPSIISSPEVIWVALSKSIGSGTMDFVQSTLAAILASQYKLDLGTVSYFYLILGLSVLIGRVFWSAFVPLMAKKVREKNPRGRTESEYRLLASVPGFFISSAGLIIYAALIQTNSSLKGVAIGLTVFGAGAFISTTFATWDTVQLHGGRSCLAMGCIDILSAICEFTFPLFAPSFQRRIKFAWSHTTLAVLTLSLGWIASFVLWIKRAKPIQYRRDETLDLSPCPNVSAAEDAERGNVYRALPMYSNQ